jgi:iron complex outermembrane receptor protein
MQEVVVRSGGAGYKANRVSPSLRLDEPLIEVPQNIQIVTRQLISDQQITDMLEGVTRNVSGVTRGEHWDNYARIYMRGSNIAAFRNGMNVTMPWGPLTEDMSMVERIEFVKGPSGFALANGEPGGFYNVVTKKPSGSTRQEVNFSVGSFDYYRASADLDGKLSKDGKLLYRLNIMGQEKNSFIKYDFNNRYSIVPVLKYLFDERTSLTLEYTYQYSSMLGTGTGYQFSKKGYFDVPKGFTTAIPGVDPTWIHDHSLFATLNHAISDSWKLTAQLAYFNYTSQGSSFWPASVDANGDMVRGVNNWDSHNENKLAQVFVNGDVHTGAVGHKILVGLDMGRKEYMADWGQYFSYAGFNIYDPVNDVATADLPVYDRSKSLRERSSYKPVETYTSVYVQDEVRLMNDRLRLTLAGRAGFYDDKAGVRDNVVTPRVGVSFSLDRSTSVYGLYDQAYVPQAGTNILTGKPLKPITGGNIEGGLKRDWAGGQWNTTLSVYQITRNNVAQSIPNDYVNYYQIGQTKAKGIEFDVRGEITRGLGLTLNYAFTDSKLTRDTAGSKNIGTATPGSTRHVTNGWLSYRVQDGFLKGFGISAGYQWQVGRYAWYVFEGGQQRLPDYFRLDGNISWQCNKLSIVANLNNILNKYLFTGGAFYGYGADFYYWTSEPPRNGRLSITYRL